MKVSFYLKLTVLVFIGVFSSTAFGQFFEVAGNYAAGDGALSVFSRDLDNDGDLDLAVANNWAHNVSVHLNNGDGTFQPACFYGAGSYPNSVFSADLNSDNAPDLIVANAISDNVSVLFNAGDGSFGSAFNYSVGDNPTGSLASDLDNDGDNDIVIADAVSDNVAVLVNNGDGTFQNAAYFGAGDGPSSLGIIDYNGDGYWDLVVPNLNSDNISILVNNGDATFSIPINYVAGDGPWSVFVADLDGDDNDDLAVTNEFSNDISIYFADGNGGFQAAIFYPVGAFPKSVFGFDIDNDGDNDLAVANRNSDNVSILINSGDGAFQFQENIIVGDAPYSVYAADLDSDGDQDLAVANQFSDNISILFNLKIPIGAVCPSVILENGIPAEWISVTLLNEDNNPVVDPLTTDDNGEVIFDSTEVGNYSVMIVTPLGYSVFPAETQINIQVLVNECVSVDFVLSPTVVSNEGRSMGYWKHQFNVYTSGRGNAQESSTDLDSYLNLVHQHFEVLDIYFDLENFDFEDAKDILTVKGGSLILDRAKQQLFALLLNLASMKIGQETIISLDDRVAAEAVTFVASLINDGNPANDELAKDICDLINNGQMVEAGIISESNIRYKLTSIDALPIEFLVSQNFPNPFNASTTIEYGLHEAGRVKIDIYDLLGRKVETLLEEDMQEGQHQIIWEASDQSSGIYLYRIVAGNFTETKKMILLK